jgi:predicted DNA-binding transcriptional regulator AlpA
VKFSKLALLFKLASMTTIEHRSIPLLHGTTAMQPTITPMPQRAATLAPGDLLDEREAAAILGASVQTLRNWRWRREGPRFRKIGLRLVRYARADLLAFIEGTQDRGAA